MRDARLIVHCPHCHAKFTVRDELLVPAGRQLRCSRCREIFQATPASSPPAVAAPAKPNRERIFLHAKAELRLKKGVIYHGATQDLNDEGVSFFPVQECGEVNPGDDGVFSFILEGASREYFTEFPCVVRKVWEDFIEIRFLAADKDPTNPTVRSGTLREQDFDLIRTGATVYVQRQGGRVEWGWEVMPPGSKLPGNIQKVVERKEPEGTCVVCRKKSSDKDGQDMYKVYFLLDLLAIQLECRKKGMVGKP